MVSKVSTKPTRRRPERFRDLVRAAGLSARRIDREYGVSFATVYRAMRGTMPGRGICRLLAQAVGVSVRDLVAAIERSAS